MISSSKCRNFLNSKKKGWTLLLKQEGSAFSSLLNTNIPLLEGPKSDNHKNDIVYK